MDAYHLSEYALIWINTKLRGVDLTDKVPRQQRAIMSGEHGVIRSCQRKGKCYVES